MRISPADNQGAVIQEARERAKRFLRRRQPFVWNATNLSPMVRRKQLSLFEDYHARTKVIFLETDWGTNLSRNESRNDAVPAHKIENMMKNLEPPERVEARTVEWHCT
ncbi:MAG: ATP-binding protein [Lachnospiraceae bacterium]|nr:ATP-binding protein [Lachnospiraceae bacterium]